MKRAILFAAAVVACVGVGQPAQADSLLYRNDDVLGTDYLGAAIAASSFSVTTTSGDLSAFTLSSFNVVVYANQNLPLPAGDLAALNAYVAGGGKVIFDDWLPDAFNGGQTFTGNTDLTQLTLGAQFSAGIGSGPLAVNNPGWGTFSTGLSGSVVAATFENGDAGIIVGNGGRTIVNGFLSDTVASEQLYTNELASFGASAVPGPVVGAGLPGLLAGVGAMLAWYRKRRSAAI